MAKIPKAIVTEEFHYLLNHFICKKHGEELLQPFALGNFCFQISRSLELDGEINFGSGEEDV